MGHGIWAEQGKVWRQREAGISGEGGGGWSASGPDEINIEWRSNWVSRLEWIGGRGSCFYSEVMFYLPLCFSASLHLVQNLLITDRTAWERSPQASLSRCWRREAPTPGTDKVLREAARKKNAAKTEHLNHRKLSLAGKWVSKAKEICSQRASKPQCCPTRKNSCLFPCLSYCE